MIIYRKSKIIHKLELIKEQVICILRLLDKKYSEINCISVYQQQQKNMKFKIINKSIKKNQTSTFGLNEICIDLNALKTTKHCGVKFKT